MTDIIQNEIDYLLLAQQLGVTPDLVIVPHFPYQKDESQAETLFDRTKLSDDLFPLLDQLSSWRHINGSEITPTEIALSWAATHSTPRSTIEEMRRLYRPATEIIWDKSHIRLEEDKFLSRVKELRGLFLGGQERLQRTGQQKRLNMLENFQQWFQSIDPLSAFDFLVEERILLLPHNISSGYDINIFNNIQTSDYLPFIAINLDSKKTEKKGVRISTIRRYKLQNNPSRSINFPIEWINSTNIPETIQMKIFVRQDTPDLYNNKSSYSTVEYIFGTNEFLLHYPLDKSESQDTVIQRFTSQVDKINFSAPIEHQITGSFVARNIIIDNRIFLHMIMTNPVLRQFLYVDESQNTFAQKKRLTLHLRLGQEHLSITLSLKKAKQSEIFYSQNQATRLKPAETYLHIQINRAPNEIFAQWTVVLVRKLLALYVQRHQDIIRDYKRIIPTFKAPIIKDTKTKSDTKTVSVYDPDPIEESKMTKLKRLKLADPRAFVTHYATKCQAPSQPLVIRESDVEQWRRKGRQVVRYPAHITNPDAKQFNYTTQNYYVSDSDDAPYLGLMRNTLSNAEDYPYLICAYKEKHLEIDPVTWDVTILKLGDDEEETQSVKGRNNKDYILDANKILDINRRGYLRTKITSFLGSDRFVRLGMPHSTSSIIHCLLMAIKTYRNTYKELSLEQKEDDVLEIRQKIAKQLPLVIIKQEAYDWSLEKIEKILLDESEFLDPAIYYRLLEEYFQVNIFTFITNENKEPALEVPRHKFFHLRSYQPNDRPIVLIYKHTQGVNEGDMPQCELIISHGDKDKFIFNDSNLLLSLQNLMKASSRVSAIQIQQSYTPNEFYENPIIESRVNISPQISFLSNPRWLLTGQSLDGAGKVRALIYTHKNNSSQVVSIYTPFLPVYPVPILSIQTTSENNAQQFTEDNNLTYENGGFFHNNIFFRFELLPSFPPQIRQLQHITHVANLMKDIIHVLFSLYPGSRNDFQQLFSIDPSVQYQVSDLPRALPRFSSYKQALSYFSRKVPSMFRNDLLLLQSDQHLQGVLHFVSLLSKSTVPSFLSRYYTSPSDFVRHHPYEMVFFDVSSLALTMVQMHSENKQVFDRLFYSPDPYLLHHQDQLFIVQNVQDFSRDRAVSVVYHWYHNLINPGFYSDPLPFDYSVHEIDYSESINIPDKTICRFQNGFCALLPLDLQIIHDL